MLDDTRPSRREKTAAPPAPFPTPPPPPEARPEFPADPLSQYQPVRVSPAPESSPAEPNSRPRKGPGCWLILLLFVGGLAAYFIFPIRTNLVLIGVDARTPGDVVGRSDTMILLTLKPIERYTGMLSIPRDLWVNIPGVGENRINTAHYFAELEQPGSGPDAVKAVIEANFGVQVDYYVRARFDSFIQLIDLLGGVQITLSEEMAGYPPGTHILDGTQALAFVRDRTTGGDDFARMRQNQVLVSGLIQTALAIENASKLPEVTRTVMSAVETDIPTIWWPRLAAAVLLSLPGGIDGRVISREMTNPFTTSQGAQVLGPNWELILPVVQEMFGR